MTTGVLAPTPILQFFDNSGNPAVGGSVLTTIGGGNAATYQDVGLGTPLPNPIPLNSRGEVSTSFGASAQCFLTPDQVYAFTLFDAQGNQLWTAPYVNGFAITAITVGQALYPYNAILDGGLVPDDANLHYPYQDVRRYGVIGNGVTDDTTALNAIGGAAWVQDVVITVPPGLICFTTDTVTMPGPFIALMMDPSSYIDYAGTPNKACLVIGDDAQIIASREFNVSVNYHSNANDYLSQDCVGVQIRGCFIGNRIRLNSATGFTINWQIYGTNDSGIAYNTFDLGISGNAQYHLDIHAVSTNGFINENLFLNGDFQIYSSYIPGATGTSYGVVFRHESGAYTGSNKNHFVKPCFQITQGGISVDRIPIIFSNTGGYNQFHNCRFEGLNGECVRITSDTVSVSNNYVDVGYLATAAGTISAYMTETDGGFSVGNRIALHGVVLSTSAWSGNLMGRAYAASAGNIGIIDMFSQGSGATTESPTGPAFIGRDFVVIAASSDAVGFYVDTSYYKNIEFRIDCLEGLAGRINICAHTSTGALINSTRAVYFGGVSENTQYDGYTYAQGADGDGLLTFRVDSNVAYIKILVSHGTSGATIRGFKVTGYASLLDQSGQNNGLAVYGGYLASVQRLASAIPNTLGDGFMGRGVTVSNAVANSGGAVVAGWIVKTIGYGSVDWGNAVAYARDQLVNNDTGKIYACTVAGTSAAGPATGPSGTGSAITDGTVTWRYIYGAKAVFTALAPIT